MADGADDADVQRLLDQVWSSDPATRLRAAATLSRIAAKASDMVLEEMSAAAPIFIELLTEDEPALRAYTACIIANVAFLEIGQGRVLEAGGVPLVVRLLKHKDRKVALHSTAAVQNLTYKSAECCAAVLQEGGEKVLNKLLRHKSDDIQQFAAGALANLQLYRRNLEHTLQRNAHRQGASGLALDQRALAARDRAATLIQAAARGRLARLRYVGAFRRQHAHGGAASRRPQSRARGAHAAGGAGGNGFGRRQVDGGDMIGANKYDTFRVKDVRTQLDVLPPSLPPIGSLSGGRGGVGLIAAVPLQLPGPKGQARKLAPLQAIKQPPSIDPISLVGGLQGPPARGNLPGVVAPQPHGRPVGNALPVLRP
ncbi:hypothetical protein KFE25_011341 [Diacronema lutheri]|uniref:Uncharacterized protein n=2 Tax=Diacronema lutheri TaxID=2081491 RepID=A0A8J6C703_DIALT|nr:hypothetical protein KFE25_011341 [Diacronema lutheri]